MGLKSIRILGVSITKNKKEEILEYIQKYLHQTQNSKLKTQNRRVKPLIVVTPNPEQIVFAQNDKHFAEILNQADVAIPDGIGLVAAMRLLGQKSDVRSQMSDLKRIPGIEFMEDLVKIAVEKGYRIGLIGGRGGVAVKALECLQSKYPGLNGWAQEKPEIRIQNSEFRIQNENTEEYFKKIIQWIREEKTRVVFVGLGAPKQEYFMARLARQFQISNFKFQIVMMSVGGSFDIISARTPRAPQAIQAVHLEWLWRLFQEPWRWHRQLALVRFSLLVLSDFFKV